MEILQVNDRNFLLNRQNIIFKDNNDLYGIVGECSGTEDVENKMKRHAIYMIFNSC